MPIILTPRHFQAMWPTNPFGQSLPIELRTPELLRVSQEAFLKRNPAAAGPEEISTPIEAFIGRGTWRINCRCNEAPITDPEWKLCCCFGCGAVYTNVVFPDNYRAIEFLLVKRPVQNFRNWKKPETLMDLVEEQIAHGDPV